MQTKMAAAMLLFKFQHLEEGKAAVHMTPEDLWSSIGLNVERNDSVYSLLHPLEGSCNPPTLPSRATSLAPSPVASCCTSGHSLRPADCEQWSRRASAVVGPRPRSLVLVAHHRQRQTSQDLDDFLALANPHHQPISGLALVDLSPLSSREANRNGEVQDTIDGNHRHAEKESGGQVHESHVKRSTPGGSTGFPIERTLMKDQANYSEERRTAMKGQEEKEEEAGVTETAAAPVAVSSPHHEQERLAPLPRSIAGERTEGKKKEREERVGRGEVGAVALGHEDEGRSSRSCELRSDASPVEHFQWSNSKLHSVSVSGDGGEDDRGRGSVLTEPTRLGSAGTDALQPSRAAVVVVKSCAEEGCVRSRVSAR